MYLKLRDKMPPKCEFQLERENGVYFTGEELKGFIILKTQRVILVNAVYVTLEGEATVRWNKGDNGAATSYFGQQRYLHERINVFSGRYFPAGKHVYSITLRLPHECPSTCQERYGQISYNISVVLDIHRGFNYIFRKPIFVCQTLNLNDFPEYMIPIKDETVKYFCHWPCKSGPILSSLEIPFGGYVSGDNISFSISIDNQSYYDIPCIEASLDQRFVFLANSSNPSNRNSVVKTLSKTEINRAILRLTKRMYEIMLVVPPNTPRTTLNADCIISLCYELKVILKTGLLHYDIDMSVPIVIGTVPFQRQDGVGWNNQLIIQPNLNENENEAVEEIIEDNRDNHSENIELPSYDSCLTPPPFDPTASSSLQTVQNLRQSSNERQQLNMNLPQFPGYNTFSSGIQNEQ